MTPLPVSVRIAWVIAGAGFVFSFLAILSIGIFILPIAVLACVYAEVRSQGRGLRLLLTGAGLPVLWIAWLNRHGPGDCRPRHDGHSQKRQATLLKRTPHPSSGSMPS